jgi:nicotinate-nucleotide adenylyltransferase
LKKIGIYGGTFDPIHHAHLILAREAREQLGLMEVRFVLAAQSPDKVDQQSANADARWEMLRVAIDGEPGFAASRIELDRPAPSYTIDTVEAFHAAQPDAELFFLLGEDNLAGLPRWHRFETLRKLVRFVVLDRTGAAPDMGHLMIRRRIDISSTVIRNRVAIGQSIRYLVPEAVEQIIRCEQLYKGTGLSNPKN